MRSPPKGTKGRHHGQKAAGPKGPRRSELLPHGVVVRSAQRESTIPAQGGHDEARWNVW
jgi:hypothetical protein